MSGKLVRIIKGTGDECLRSVQFILISLKIVPALTRVDPADSQDLLVQSSNWFGFNSVQFTIWLIILQQVPFWNKFCKKKFAGTIL